GVRYFSCPDGCGLFVPVSLIRVRHWSSKNSTDAQEQTRDHPRRSNHAVNGQRSDDDRSNHHQLRHISFHRHQSKIQAVVSRTAESVPVVSHNNLRGAASPSPFLPGQRVCVSVEGAVHAGEVRFCGLLPGRASTTMYDTPAGTWDGHYKEQKLCHIPSPLYGLLLPASNVSADDDDDDDGEEEDEEDAEEYGETALQTELEVGSMVEVNNPPLFGVIRWIGHISAVQELVAGIELGLFIKLRNCRRDSRFPIPEKPVNQVERCNSIEWGSERVDEHTPPVDGDEARQLYEGSKRGIQGHLNSCYLDATLYRHSFLFVCSLFSCCSSADWVLFWPSDAETDQSSKQAQDLLRCEIVNPLRRSMTQQAQECHLYQLFPPTLPLSPVDSPIVLAPPASMRVASVQTLLESSFLHAGLKFVEKAGDPQAGEDCCSSGAMVGPYALHSPANVSLCSDVHRNQPLRELRQARTPGLRLVVLRQHGRPRRWGRTKITTLLLNSFFMWRTEKPHICFSPGGENGFNIPQVRACPEVCRYLGLSEEELSRLDASSLRESARRLLCDSYMCLYHSPELSLYK
ncbi:hypothetical protein XENOCAPTIV_003346, partial [Xenoophorus captivus]